MANLGDQECPPGSQGRTEVLPVQWRKHLDLDVSSQFCTAYRLDCSFVSLQSHRLVLVPWNASLAILAPVQTVLGNVSFINLLQYDALHANPAGVYQLDHEGLVTIAILKKPDALRLGVTVAFWCSEVL